MTFREAQLIDPVVHQSMRDVPLEEIICRLVEQKQEMMKRINEIYAIAPKRIGTPNGLSARTHTHHPTMTTSEALDWMQANHPTRSASASKQAWYHTRIDEARPAPDFTISVLPGFNGESCQLFSAHSVEDCLIQIQDATRLPIKGEPNNE